MPATRPAFSGPTKSGFKVVSSDLSANINLNDLRRLGVVSMLNKHCVCIRYAHDKAEAALCLFDINMRDRKRFQNTSVNEVARTGR